MLLNLTVALALPFTIRFFWPADLFEQPPSFRSLWRSLQLVFPNSSGISLMAACGFRVQWQVLRPDSSLILKY